MKIFEKIIIRILFVVISLVEVGEMVVRRDKLRDRETDRQKRTDIQTYTQTDRRTDADG